MATVQGWHIVSGDWRALDHDRRRRFWPLVADRIRVALEFEVEGGQVEIDALALPFYRGQRTDSSGESLENGEFVYQLIQVGLPVDIDFVGLKRWCFFLWDGDGDLVALDGLSRTINDFDERVGIDLGDEGDALAPARAAAYFDFFSAFLLAEYRGPDAPGRFDRYQSVFLPISGESGCAWTEAAAAALRAVAMEADSPYSDLLDERPVASGVEEFAEPLGSFGKRVTGDKRVFRSAALADRGGSLSFVFGRTLFRAQVELVFHGPEGGRWRRSSVEMIDDDRGRIVAGVAPLFVKSWHRRIAFLSARAQPLAEETAIRPGRFAALLKDARFGAASRGVSSAFLPLAGQSDEQERASLVELFRLFATRHWGGPLGSAHARVIGDLELAAPGEEVATRLELDAPIRVAGHLVFAGASFVAPVSLRGWEVEGRIDGGGARALRSLSLGEFRVRNGIGRVSQRVPGLAEYPDNAVKLDELRIEGSLELRSLVADGGLSLRRAQVGGRLSLEATRLERHPVGDRAGKPGRLAAEHLEVGGSLEMTGLWTHGVVVLKAAVVAGDVDLSGARIAQGLGQDHPGWTSISLDNASIGGDLRFNSYAHLGLDPELDEEGRKEAVDALAPTLIGGAIDAENVRVRGSVLACHCHVLGNLDFRGARIEHNLMILGLHGAGALPAAARASIVDGEISAYEASIGGYISLEGTVCAQIDFNFVEAKAFFVHPDPANGSGLPLVVVGRPGAAGDEAPCVSLDHARIGGVSARGLRLGAGLRGIGMRVEGNLRMNAAAGMPLACADGPSFGGALLAFARTLADQAASGGAAPSRTDDRREDAHQAFRDEITRRLAGESGAEGAAAGGTTALNSSMNGDVCLDGLQCGGNLELKALGAGRVQLDGARIANKLLLSDEASGADGGGAEIGPRAVLRGGLRLRNAEIGGVACLDRADLEGPMEIRDSDLGGGLSATDCRFAPSGSTAAGAVPDRLPGLRINNVRTRSDLRLGGLVAGECEISDSAIGGDLAFGCDADRAQCPSPHEPGPRASLHALRIVSNRIDGEVVLDRLDVAGSIDLTDTRAARGLRVGTGAGGAEAVTCAHLDLARFATDADVDLRLLALRDVHGDGHGFAGARADPAAGARRPDSRAGGQWLRRYWDDLVLGEDEPLRKAAGAGRALLARHATIGGEFRLPRGVNALRFADLAFSSADRLEVAGVAFSGEAASEVALVLRGARFDSAHLEEPLPRRVDLREAAVAHWDIQPASGQSASSSQTYLDFVHRSWPYTQAAYTKLEQDYRDGGQHKDADYFLAAAGWRTWRWSMIRPAFESWAAGLLILLAAVFAIYAAASFGWGWGVIQLVLAGTLYAFLSPFDWFKRASRSLIGLFIVAPFQLLYGFGIRWWLPLVLSTALLILVTVPVLSDCRNLQGSDGRAAAHVPPPAPPPAGQGAVPSGSLLEALGAETRVGPAVVSSCSFVAGRSSGEGGGQVDWDLGEAFWLALRYHLPVVPLDTFFHGERSESVRPSAGPLHLEWGSPGGRRLVATIDRISPIAYARTIYLLSWLVIPFSLIFAAARIQRKFRLQKE